MTELVKANETALEPSPEAILSPLVQAAMDGNLDTDKLKELLAIQKDYEANEAKKAYHKAVTAFKASTPKAVKDKINSQYGSEYISKEGLVNAVNPYLSQHGLSTHWEMEQTDANIKVTCVLTHELGHSEQASMSAPPDTSGKKNPIQQIKSTKTYLEIATYESITGIASSGSCNDDGASSSIPVEVISEAQIEALTALMSEVGADEAQFMKICKVESWGQMPASKYAGAIKRLEQKRKAG